MTPPSLMSPLPPRLHGRHASTCFVENELSPALISLSPLREPHQTSLQRRPVRSSTCFYTPFNLDSRRSTGFASGHGELEGTRSEPVFAISEPIPTMLDCSSSLSLRLRFSLLKLPSMCQLVGPLYQKYAVAARRDHILVDMSPGPFRSGPVCFDCRSTALFL